MIVYNDMNGQKLKENLFTSSMSFATNTTVSSGTFRSRQTIAQTFRLIWIGASIGESADYYQDTLTTLQSVISEVLIFTQCDEGIDFLTETFDMTTFLIVEGTIGQEIVPLIHDIPQLDAIYILSEDTALYEQWPKKYIKLKGIHTEIKPICEALKFVAKQYNQDSIAMSFISVSGNGSSPNLNQLEPSFMYTQLFKEILLDMEYNQQSVETFSQFWRQHYIKNTYSKVIDEFEDSYCPQSSIRWYTREYFLYEMLNRSLRMLEAETIIYMGFFIRDLHQQIEELYQNQISTYHGKPFTVYRGQKLLIKDFEKLLKTKGGLMSFNNFLSTSPDRNVSLGFAMRALNNTDMVGILFEITVNPCISSTPFAAIRKVSYYQAEEEYLFSMHSVFRIGEVKRVDKDSSLYQLNLTLTADDDQELRILTERIREEVVGETGWQRLGTLLLKLGQFQRAEELYNVLLGQTSDDSEKVLYYNQLGYAKDEQGDYQKAIEYCEKALEIRKKTLPANHPLLATSYNNIGTVYMNMGEYSRALSYHERALEIRQNTLPANHPDLATSYNNIGAVYDNMGEYSKALSSHEKALEIRQKTLPANHPDLATSYNNIGLMYKNIGEYSKALSLYEKALEIDRKTLPANHPDLATSYNNIGSVYMNMGEYSKALSFHENALEIKQKNLPANHPDLATSYNNIGIVYDKMGEYSKALSYYEKALEIRQNTLPANHPDLATSYNNIGLMYNNMGEYRKALSLYEKALEIDRKTLPANHPDLATSYNNIGSVYSNMGEYCKALSFYEKALEIREKTLSASHPSLVTSYNNIGSVCVNMGDYSKALSFYDRGSKICQKTLPSNHPLLATSYNNVGLVYYHMGDYSKALIYLERALQIQQCSLPPNHPSIQNVRKSIEILKKKL